jgi:RNA polymerase sigma-70 factor (ECF subfamily)
MNDNQIGLQELNRMDAEALAEVFDRYAPAIYKYTYHHTGSALLADQTVGEVFARLLEQCALGRGPVSNLRTYLFEIAYHCVVDEIRYSQRLQSLQTADSAPPAPRREADRALEQQVLLEVVRRAMRADLSDDQRHVLILRFLEGFSLRQTARIMGKTVSHVKVLQGRALAALRRALDRQELAGSLFERASAYHQVY